MEKFADLQYVRPDMEKVFARVSVDIAALKEAKSYEEFKNAYMDFVEADTELETAKTVAHIRNTINLLDSFYEGEMAYFNSQMPKYGILKKEMGEVIVASPFKGELEKEFGSILLQNHGSAETALRRVHCGRSGGGSRACQPVHEDPGGGHRGFPRRAARDIRTLKTHAEYGPH